MGKMKYFMRKSIILRLGQFPKFKKTANVCDLLVIVTLNYIKILYLHKYDLNKIVKLSSNTQNGSDLLFVN
jgi:hypothetical protein